MNEELLVGNYNNSNNSIIKSIIIFILFHFLYLIIPLFILIFPFYLLIFSNNYLIKILSNIFVIIYWGNIGISKVHKRYGSPWKFIDNLWIVRYIIEWLPVRIFRKVKLDPKELYVFACHPHGTLAFNRAAVGFSTSTLWDKAFPGVTKKKDQQLKLQKKNGFALFYKFWDHKIFELKTKIIR